MSETSRGFASVGVPAVSPADRSLNANWITSAHRSALDDKSVDTRTGQHFPPKHGNTNPVVLGYRFLKDNATPVICTFEATVVGRRTPFELGAVFGQGSAPSRFISVIFSQS